MITALTDVLWRSLLFAAGSAATAAAFYSYYNEQSEREKNTKKHRVDKTGHQDAVCEQVTEPAVVKSMNVVQEKMMVFESEEKILTVVMSDTHLEDRLRLLEELLCEAQCILQTGKNKETLIHQDELLKVFLAEAKEKHKTSMETISQLEENKSNLTNQVKRLTEKVEGIKNSLCKAYSERGELMNELVRERKAYSVLQSDSKKKEKTLLYQDKILKVSLVKAKMQHRNAVETMTQLEEEKAKLTNQVKELRGTLENMKKHLFKINRQRDEFMDKCMEETVAYSILQVEIGKMKKTLIHQEELLKVSLSDAEKKHQKSVKSITQSEDKKSKLTYQVERLSQKVDNIKNSLFRAYSEHDELIKECVQEWNVYSTFQSDYNKIQKTLLYQDRFLKVALDEAKEKHQKAVETITQLKKEKSKLTNQVGELKGTLENMKNDLSKRNSERDDLMDVNEKLLAECVQEREAYRVLQSDYNKIEKIMLHQDKFLKVSLAEAKEKHQKDVETITQLEKEKSELTNHLELLRGTVEDMKDELFETHRKCNELMDDQGFHPKVGPRPALPADSEDVSFPQPNHKPAFTNQHDSTSSHTVGNSKMKRKEGSQKFCWLCHEECCITIEGSERMFSVMQDCQSCGYQRDWTSHPPSVEHAQTLQREEEHPLKDADSEEVVVQIVSSDNECSEQVFIKKDGSYLSNDEKEVNLQENEVAKKRKRKRDSNDSSDEPEPCLDEEDADSDVSMDEDQVTVPKEDGQGKLVLWCTQCETKASLSCSVLRHKKVFCCAQCSAGDNIQTHRFKTLPVRFDDITGFQKHVEREHRSKLFYKHCQDCGKFVVADPKTGALNEHKCEHKSKFICPECGKRLLTEVGLKSHHTQLHSGAKHPCKYCLKVFKTRSAKLIHEQTHLKENRGLAVITKEINSPVL
ncbi:Zinc finger protein 28 [Bagarius yarrelli]|uniref:Zinc finger protein 28 n=1 Tax=Bagarius yarrelli TaxID=175774 RepID=A0A556VAX2_BAGYA|nr:Zinc finger protein 28 [Bagarius yarrelli]